MAGCSVQRDREEFAVFSRCSCFDVVSGVYGGLGLRDTV